MKTLPIDTKQHLKKIYAPNFYNAMTGNPVLVDEICSFLERHDKYKISYAQAFFSSCEINVYELDGKKCLFVNKNNVFNEVPLSNEDIKNDWSSWLKKAKKVEELR